MENMFILVEGLDRDEDSLLVSTRVVYKRLSVMLSLT